MRNWFAVSVLVMLSVVVNSARADGHAESYQVAGHGALLLSLPEGWQSEVQQPADDAPPTIVLTPKTGAPFQVSITPVWSMQGSISTDDQFLLASTEAAAAEAQPRTLQDKLAVIKFVGASSHGYYFSATTPSEYLCLARGIVRVGELVLTFTVLTNKGQSEIVRNALQLVGAARHEPNAA